MSFPTAVTAKTGIPYFSPSSTSLERLFKVWCSYLLPTKIDNAIHDALILIASSIDVVIVSFERSSPKILVPPETRSTIGIFDSGSTQVRKIPLVNIKESAYFSNGSMVFFGSSNLSVGPKKYPWSTANMTPFLSCGFIILDKRFLIPQSIYDNLIVQVIYIFINYFHDVTIRTFMASSALCAHLKASLDSLISKRCVTRGKRSS